MVKIVVPHLSLGTRIAEIHERLSSLYEVPAAAQYDLSNSVAFAEHILQDAGVAKSLRRECKCGVE